MKDQTRSLTPRVKELLSEIHALSQRINSSEGSGHRDVLIKFIRTHSDEINTLFCKGDPHAVIETGDLAVLCLELIMESGRDPDEILNICYSRFINKLRSILDDRDGGV